MRLLAGFIHLAAAAAILLAASMPALAQVAVSGRAHVIDGDTLHLSTSEAGKPVKVRLQGVAAPERSDVGGAEATRFVERLAEGRQVRCELDGSRSKDRFVGVCFLEAAGGGKDIGVAVIEAGLATGTARSSPEGATRP
jgi:endonuclease YncB( thermonuclease family)